MLIQKTHSLKLFATAALIAGLVGTFQQQHPSATFGRRYGAHQPCCARSNDDEVGGFQC